MPLIRRPLSRWSILKMVVPFHVSRRAAWLSVVALALMLGCGRFAPARAQSVDMNVIFNCNAGGPLGKQTPEQCAASRDTVLSTCTACHSFVPIVKAHKTDSAWASTLATHRPRVPDLTDDQFRQLQQFLTAHFNDKLPPPKLPPALEALGLPPA